MTTTAETMSDHIQRPCQSKTTRLHFSGGVVKITTFLHLNSVSLKDHH